ncbi:MAG: leucine--tRNA ligase [Lentimicrobiaceae bacterium]|nr:leucine--tRNA ligase [Lentimicrobiaceae bacterium]
MDYSFKDIEEKWQKRWQDEQVYETKIDEDKPKFYVLDMFPYPSGAGLHVGHPLGYIASDIFSRYKKLKGFNVLHPMGYDAFGLPAEQYAIQTGTHPAVTTEKNIVRYRHQLDRIGFSYDWSREVKTCDPKYYHWTQWAFVKMFNSWYNNETQKAEDISTLIKEFERNGNVNINASTTFKGTFTANDWNSFAEKEQQDILMNYRIAFRAESSVNWCPELGTVLANDEVSEGLSIRGGYPVEKKLMMQWMLRITAYADRLLDGLDDLDWNESIKEIQRNWIGKSKGASIWFDIENSDKKIEVFTTRPDTIYGATFMVLAPEHELVAEITNKDQEKAVADYVAWTNSRTEVERMSEVKKVSGEFTGAYAINPLNGNKIPIWIADYVLMGYGTGAIMAVPAHDSRDFLFARHFNLPIIQVVKNTKDEVTVPTDEWTEPYDSKDGYSCNSDIINGLSVEEAIKKIIEEVENKQIGKAVTNYRLRDVIFSRQRYWGEPIPIYYKDGIAYSLKEEELPLCLPNVDSYLPTSTGEPPLAGLSDWKTNEGYQLEVTTMPGFAGSSAYYLRYMDPKNDKELVSQKAINYWQNVDLYVGGAEHSTGHLLYARFWNMFLFDLGITISTEPFKKMINQGMIQGRSSIAYRIKGENTFVSHNLIGDYDVQPIHVDIGLVHNDILNIEKFKQWRPELADAEFILEDGKYICGWEIEKMSKSLYNVVNPDELIDQYGADTLRIYEMFLGPIEQAKPWDTNGIEGVSRFIRKFWRLFHDNNNDFVVSDETPTKDELKILHKTIKKVEEDIERFSFNTGVSALMICVNELTDLKCNKRSILNDLIILASPYAPHVAEELWHLMGNQTFVVEQKFPVYNPEYIVDDTFKYPVSFNGKTRFFIELPASLSNAEIEAAVRQAPETTKWVADKSIKKIIIVPKKIVNFVIG